MSNKFSILNESIKNILSGSNYVDYDGKSYITVLYSTVFQNDFFLQITWKNDTIYWYRTTWLKEKDRRALADIFCGKFDEKDLKISLTLEKEQGKTVLDDMKGILEKIVKLTIKPVFQNENYGKDGQSITLTIGSDYAVNSFSWQNCGTPTEWSSLDNLIGDILKLNTTFISTEKTLYNAYLDIERNNQTYEQIFEIKKIVI